MFSRRTWGKAISPIDVDRASRKRNGTVSGARASGRKASCTIRGLPANCSTSATGESASSGTLSSGESTAKRIAGIGPVPSMRSCTSTSVSDGSICSHVSCRACQVACGSTVCRAGIHRTSSLPVGCNNAWNPVGLAGVVIRTASGTSKPVNDSGTASTSVAVGMRGDRQVKRRRSRLVVDVGTQGQLQPMLADVRKLDFAAAALRQPPHGHRRAVETVRPREPSGVTPVPGVAAMCKTAGGSPRRYSASTGRIRTGGARRCQSVGRGAACR